MKNQRLLAVVLGVWVWSTSFGQAQDSPPKQKPSDGDVVRITTNLVQVDAVITDKNGKLVTDLKPEELQLFENNRSQKITHFSYRSYARVVAWVRFNNSPPISDSFT